MWTEVHRLEGNESAYDITSPVFSNVTISTSLHPVATTTTGTAPEGTVVIFAGTYSPLFIGLENRNLLYLGADNTLYYPNTAITINSCRAHFRLQGIEAGDPVAPSSPVKAFVLNFDGADATGIKTTDFTDYTDNKCASWYTLDDLMEEETTPQNSTLNDEEEWDEWDEKE